MNALKIGYFADGRWSHLALNKLLADPDLKIVFICARADSPDPVLKAVAADKGLDFIINPNINSNEFLNLINDYQCDIFVSMSFNQIFKERIINLTPKKIINCHAGKLPFYRGRNILNWALINDEREFGITVHYVDEGIDTGDIILQRNYKITDNDNYATLLDRAYDACAEILYDSIKMIQNDTVSPIDQKTIHPLGFYCTARRNGDERINWNQSSRDVFNLIRAICRPGPEARTFLEDMEIRINKAQFLPEAPSYKGIVGSVIGIENDTFFVKTSDSYIKIIEWSGSRRPRIGDRFK